MDTLVNILTSLGAHVNDDYVVHYAIEGLLETYNQVCGYMHWKDTFPDLKTARTLLITKEMRLKSKALALPMDSSSPMVLVAESGNNRRSSSTPQVKSSRPCFNYAKGTCRFGDSCRYVHDPNAHLSASSHLNNSVYSLSTILNLCMHSSVSVGDGHSIPVTNTGHSILPTPSRTLHLNNVLITPHIVKKIIFVRQFVRDNDCTIEFDSFGFSVKDFMTRWVLLRCDSTGDLYLVTSPSPIPHAFLVSHHTWYQRLGHPRSKVLHSLVSNNIIYVIKKSLQYFAMLVSLVNM
ncbi:ribonuclease H-like domain-containing protein [Tanacetum coccineum]